MSCGCAPLMSIPVSADLCSASFTMRTLSDKLWTYLVSLLAMLVVVLLMQWVKGGKTLSSLGQCGHVLAVEEHRLNVCCLRLFSPAEQLCH